ncbi:MAG: RNA polymerase sigma factor [Planctomycetota bacterium]
MIAGNDMAGTPTAENRTLSDEELIALLASGESERAMSGLEDRYGKRIYHFVHGMVRDTWLAQDVTQEVFEKVLLKHDLYRAGTNFRAWLFEVARNQALSALRVQKRMPRPVSSLHHATEDQCDSLLDSVPDPGNGRELEEREFMAALSEAIDRLPEHYYQVFDLCVRQGRAYQEASRILGIPQGTVAIRIMRARRRLFGELGRHVDRLRRPPACFQKH